MSEHDDRPDHEAKAEELEYELAEMQERTDTLEKKIGDTSEDWESRKADEGVPGAVGESEHADEPDGDDGADGDRDGDGEDLDFGRALAEEDSGDEDSDEDEKD